MTYPSFLDQIGGWQSSADPIMGKPTRPYNGPYPSQDPGAAATDMPSSFVQPAAAAPASPVAAATGPAAAAPAMPADMGVSDPRKYGVQAPAEAAPEEPGLEMGADAGGEAGKSFAAPAAPSGPTVVPARHLNRVGGQDFSAYTAGMSPAAQAAVQALMHTSPDATGTNLTTGQSFVMPGGTYADPNAARRAAAGADLQVAQQQEQTQRAKADAYKQANSPAALEQQRADNQRKTFLAEHPPAAPPVPGTMADIQLQEEQEKLKGLQRGNQPAVQPSPAYGDAQRVISQLDPTNPQHVPVINALRGMKPTDLQAPQIPMQQAGQLLHPAAPEGKQRSQTVQAAQQQVGTNPLVKAPIDEVAQRIQSEGVNDQNRAYLNSRVEDAVREAVANGADESTVRQLIQAKLHGQNQEAFTPESPVNSFLGTAAMATPLGVLPKIMQYFHNQRNQNIASFINQPTSE